jgi:two-component system chemotaxis response regulator CheY
MEIITTGSEDYLTEMLPQIERDPSAWMMLHVNLTSVHDQTLSHEGLSKESLAKIRKMSTQLAKKILDWGLNQFDGKILVFEDSDIVAFFAKKADLMQGVLDRLRNEFTKSGLIDILVIEEMKEKLAHLVTLSAVKKKTAENHRLKLQAVEAGENLLHDHKHNPEITRAIHKMRRERSSSCILIIEDDVLTRGMVASLLKAEHQVVQAKDAQSGVVAYVANAPNVVFLDIHLPGGSGHEILKRIIQLDPEAYVVMLSSDSAAESVRSTQKGGASGFICKPFSKEKVIEYIKKCPSLHNNAKLRALGWSW